MVGVHRQTWAGRLLCLPRRGVCVNHECVFLRIMQVQPDATRPGGTQGVQQDTDHLVHGGGGHQGVLRCQQLFVPARPAGVPFPEPQAQGVTVPFTLGRDLRFPQGDLPRGRRVRLAGQW